MNSWVGLGASRVRIGRRAIIGLIASSLSLSGCASRGGSVPYDVANFGAPDIEADASSNQERVSAQDKLKITVFQESDLTGEYQVGDRGEIQFPLIGDIKVQDMMLSEVASEITRRLGQKYVRAPSVQVVMAERAQQTITVDGAVRQAGVLPIKGSTTLIRAVAMARGTTEDANLSRVVVFRTIKGQRMAAAFDMKAIRRGEAEDPPIYGNDIVVVDGSSARAIFRDILSSVPILGIFRPF